MLPHYLNFSLEVMFSLTFCKGCTCLLLKYYSSNIKSLHLKTWNKSSLSNLDGAIYEVPISVQQRTLKSTANRTSVSRMGLQTNPKLQAKEDRRKPTWFYLQNKAYALASVQPQTPTNCHNRWRITALTNNIHNTVAFRLSHPWGEFCFLNIHTHFITSSHVDKKVKDIHTV